MNTDFLFVLHRGLIVSAVFEQRKSLKLGNILFVFSYTDGVVHDTGVLIFFFFSYFVISFAISYHYFIFFIRTRVIAFIALSGCGFYHK